MLASQFYRPGGAKRLCFSPLIACRLPNIKCLPEPADPQNTVYP
jgi:hypothetical protein